MKSYAGIGSRQTPPDTLILMEEFAFMAAAYMELRSGAAEGADTAFELGCVKGNGECQIFLPWKKFNGSNSVLYDAHPRAGDIAAEVHPHYKYMKRPGKLLIARNMHQILGWNLDDPVEFVICWTKDGCESHETYNPTSTGGTGSAIALASKVGAPIYNLFNPMRFADATEHLARLKP